MKNADLFKDTFGTYATEIWSMSENDFLKWLNEDAEQKTEQEPKGNFDASWNIVEKIKPKAGGAWHVCKQFDLQEPKTDNLDKMMTEINEYGSLWVEVENMLEQAKQQVLEIIDKYRQEVEQ